MNTAIELKINDPLGTIREERQRLNQLEAACVTLLEVPGRLAAPCGHGTKRRRLIKLPERTNETPGTKGTEAPNKAVPNGIGKRVRAVIEELAGDFDLEKVRAELPDANIESVRGALSYMLKKGELVSAGQRGSYRLPGKTKSRGMRNAGMKLAPTDVGGYAARETSWC
jgi:hypothetical protein